MRQAAPAHRPNAAAATPAARSASAAPDTLRAHDSTPAAQLRAAPRESSASYATARASSQARTVNRTGLPDRLKSGMESLSGIALDDVRVHRNSARPAQLQALAHTQGSEIHLGPGQERHLPHEAWHVVQQKQGRVRPTMQLGGTAINDDAGLEREADTMGARAARPGPLPLRTGELAAPPPDRSGAVAQRIEIEVKRHQKLIKDTHGGKLGGTPFEWDSKFNVTIQNDKVVVTIRIKAAIEPELFQEVWANQVARQWSNRFMLQFEGKNYPIVVQLQQVTHGEHYPITVSSAESALSSGARGHFGTENMMTWGKHDTTNISHEVGHMLGNIDEYGVVEADWGERDYLKNPSTTIMAVPENNPIAQHYYLIQWAAEQELNKSHSVAKTGTVLPYVARSGGMASLGSGVSMQELLSARLKPVKPSARSSSPPPDDFAPPVVALSSPKPKPVPTVSKDVVPSLGVSPVTTKPVLKPPPKVSKEVVEQPNELEQAFARLRQRQQAASSVPAVEPPSSMPKPVPPKPEPPKPEPPKPVPPKGETVVPSIIPSVVPPQPQAVVPQVQAPEPVVPEEEDAPQPQVSAEDIRRGRDIIRRCYEKALEYAAEYENEEDLSQRITARFQRIAGRYRAADPEDADFAATLQACVQAARNIVRRLAGQS